MVSSKPTSPRAADPTDRHVGGCIRTQRLLLGMTQERLAEAIGLGIQQLQKYEKGTNRISAGRLEQIARALQVPVSFFFEAVPGQRIFDTPAGQQISPTNSPPPSRSRIRPQDDMSQRTYVDEFLADPDGPKLAEVFLRVKRLAVRQRIVHLVEAIASAREEPEPAE